VTATAVVDALPLRRRKPFTAIRKGIIEHVLAGRLRGAAFAVYIWLHLQADHRTGTVRTNAARVSSELGFHPVTVRRALASLRDQGYVRYAAEATSRQLYEVAIEKYHAHFAEAGRHGRLHGALQERAADGRQRSAIRASKKKEERKDISLRVRSADAAASNDDLDPVEAPATAERLTRAEALAAAPAALRETLELFWLKTAREDLAADELAALRELDQAHTPAVIQRQITRAVERFTRRGDDPRTLTVRYIWESLKAYATRKPPATAAAVPATKYPPGLTVMRLGDESRV
jgi:Fe2+ or Zn2+ uptake regulation protein